MITQTLLSTTELAHLLGVSKQRVSFFTRKYGIGKKVGCFWVYDLDDVQIIKARKGKRGKKMDYAK